MSNLLTVRLFFVLFAYAAVTPVQARMCQMNFYADSRVEVFKAKDEQNVPVIIPDTVALIDELISPNWVFHNRSVEEWFLYYPKAKIKRTPVRNTHNTSKVDTVIELTTEKTHLRFYCAEGKHLLLEAQVSLEPLAIGKGLSMGMNKSDFMRCFSETEEGMQQNVVVVVMDEEETAYYFFTFEQNILVAVRYEGMID